MPLTAQPLTHPPCPARYAPGLSLALDQSLSLSPLPSPQPADDACLGLMHPPVTPRDILSLLRAHVAHVAHGTPAFTSPCRHSAAVTHHGPGAPTRHASMMLMIASPTSYPYVIRPGLPENYASRVDTQISIRLCKAQGPPPATPFAAQLAVMRCLASTTNTNARLGAGNCI